MRYSGFLCTFTSPPTKLSVSTIPSANVMATGVGPLLPVQGPAASIMHFCQAFAASARYLAAISMPCCGYSAADSFAFVTVCQAD
jgi:hypothetical protein